MANTHRLLVSLCLLAIVFSSAVFANVSAQRMMAPPTAASASQSNQVNFLGLKKTLTSGVGLVINQLAANSTAIPPPQASGKVLSASKVLQPQLEAKSSTPLGTPVVLPNGTRISPTVDCSQAINHCNHWWDILYYSQSASDYGGTFQARANTISGFATGLYERDDLLILPLNIAVGYSNNLVWFQFDIDFYHTCVTYVCTQGVQDWTIWNNVDPTGACSSTSVTYNSQSISSTSSYSSTALAYTPGDSYHWDFYAASSPANTVVFLVVDDSKGGVGAGAYWWYEWQVASLSLVYNSSCFSPATAVEGYTDKSTTSLSNVPSWLFSEGYPSETYGTSDITGPYSESSGISEGEPSGISETMYPIASSGDWYWLIFESGLTQTLTTNVSSGSGSVSPNCPSGCSEAVGTSTSVTAYPSTYWQLSSWTISGASCSGGASGNPCQFTMPNNAVTASATFTSTTYSVTFTESGIPSGTSWGVTVNGNHQSTSSGTSIQFSGLTGTVSYSYDSPVAGSGGTYSCTSSCSGSVSGPGTVTATYTFTATCNAPGAGNGQYNVQWCDYTNSIVGAPITTKTWGGPNVAFNWDSGYVDNTGRTQWVYALAVGSFSFSSSGTWTLTTLHDDGLRVSIDGNQIYNVWNWIGVPDSTTIPISAGTHTISIQYYAGGVPNLLSLSFAPPVTVTQTTTTTATSITSTLTSSTSTSGTTTTTTTTSTSTTVSGYTCVVSTTTTTSVNVTPQIATTTTSATSTSTTTTSTTGTLVTTTFFTSTSTSTSVTTTTTSACTLSLTSTSTTATTSTTYPPRTVVFHTTPTTFEGATMPGSISACGGSFTDGQSSLCGATFSATANPPSPSSSWQFDHWSWSGGVTCTSNTTNPASCSSSLAGGSLTAVYGAEVSFHTNPTSSALIAWGSCGGPSEGDGGALYSTGYGSVSACYVPSGYTLASWSCSYGLTCSGSNDPTLVTFNGPGNITLNLKTGSLTCPSSTSLSVMPSSTGKGTTFAVSGSLTANGVGVGDETIVIVFGWSTKIVTVTTQSDGSYSYTATAPSSAGLYNVDVFFLGNYTTGCPEYLPSKATAVITVT